MVTAKASAPHPGGRPTRWCSLQSCPRQKCDPDGGLRLILADIGDVVEDQQVTLIEPRDIRRAIERNSQNPSYYSDLG